MDIGRIALARLCIEFREIVLSRIQAIGSARVHRWTLHTDPAAFCYESRNLGKTNYQAGGHSAACSRKCLIVARAC
jgi:hypothetical protein